MAQPVNYEYKIIKVRSLGEFTEEQEAALNEAGLEGWLLVSTVSLTDTQRVFVMARPID